jgi:hypothetical protein
MAALKRRLHLRASFEYSYIYYWNNAQRKDAIMLKMEPQKMSRSPRLSVKEAKKIQ